VALINCEDCNRPISRRAQACPHCGAPRGGAFGPAIGVVILLAVVGYFGWIKYEEQERSRALEALGGAEAVDKKRPAAAPKPAARKAPADPQRALFGARALKKSLRFPDGTKLTSALVVEGTGAICYEYEGPNAFGGTTSGKAVLAPESNLVLNSEMEGFWRTWNQECDKKKGSQVATGINWFAL